jgi:hypothetical protein
VDVNVVSERVSERARVNNEREPMDIIQIINWERRLMAGHSLAQHNWHCWAWLNHHLTIWSDAHPIKVRSFGPLASALLLRDELPSE